LRIEKTAIKYAAKAGFSLFSEFVETNALPSDQNRWDGFQVEKFNLSEGPIRAKASKMVHVISSLVKLDILYLNYSLPLSPGRFRQYENPG